MLWTFKFSTKFVQHGIIETFLSPDLFNVLKYTVDDNYEAYLCFVE